MIPFDPTNARLINLTVGLGFAPPGMKEDACIDAWRLDEIGEVLGQCPFTSTTSFK